MDKKYYKKKYERRDEVLKYLKIFSSQSEKMISELEIYITRKIARRIKNRKNYLDIACGFGRITIPISSLFEKVTGLDLSYEMLKRFKSKNIRLIKADAENTKLPDKQFDFITCFRFIMNFDREERIKILKEINRILRDDGTFVCNLHINKYSLRGLMTNIRNKFTRQKQPTLSYFQIASDLKKSGFKIIKLYGIKIIPYYSNHIFFDYEKLMHMEKILSDKIIKFFADGYIIICKKVIEYGTD